jgi:aspartyl-tRNA(Asn)/glutamyl-tRNA(Gln) amidotransferase subunit B
LMAEEKKGAWVKGLLEKKGIEFRFLEHEAVTKPVDSARARGVELKQIAKALLYMVDGRPVLVVLPGDKQVNEGKLLKFCKAKRIRSAASVEVKHHTGCAVGLVPPLVEGVRKIVDKSLLENKEVSFNAGVATAGIIMRTPELLRALGNFETADIALGKTVIGLECHIQLATESKLFCGCPTTSTEPNSSCCEICLGFPGSKPVLNKRALDFALKVAVALNCEINRDFFFSRKTYFYPDMAKNFQITQFEVPIGKNGFLTLSSGKKVRIKRVHLEEDPAALVHEAGLEASLHTLVDYNRSGVPLVEVVTEPDLGSPQEARDFLDQLSTVLDYLGVFDLREGTLKADSNISFEGGARVEIKNITGKRGVEKALAFEAARQRALLAKGETIGRETRAFDEKTQTTKPLRGKETEEDYGYIMESDLAAVCLDESHLDGIRRTLPELHDAKAKRFMRQYSLSEYTARVLSSNPRLSGLFEETAKQVDAGLAAKFLSRELLGVLNYNGLSFEEAALKPSELIGLLRLMEKKEVTEKNAKEALIKYILEGASPTKYLEEKGLKGDLEGEEVREAIRKVLDGNTKAVADYLQGEKKALHFLVGKVMQLTKGKADAREVRRLIEEKLGGKNG